MKRFVICPGYINSQTDGDRHHIGIGQLIRLYHVDPQQCIIESERVYYGANHDWSQYIFLRPRYYGDYAEYLTRELEKKGWEL